MRTNALAGKDTELFADRLGLGSPATARRLGELLPISQIWPSGSVKLAVRAVTRLRIGRRHALALLLAPLPVGERSRIVTSLPLFKGTILVVKTEVAARKPPLDGTAERNTSAPAVRVAGALAIARVVDSP
jgi:hypothetical protein